ncbi:hypothetical protein GCM10027615_17270 [Plantactinospora veratri]
MVSRLVGQGPPAHQVWLPPLSQAPALDEILGPVITDPARGLTFGNPELHGALQVPVAMIDKPFEQRRDLLWLSLEGGAGHVAVAGGPQSGKSSLLRTMICGLALTHTPAEVQVYCLDFGGGSLAALRDLPHVGGVAGRSEAAAVRRTVGEISTLLNEREQRFAELGVESMPAYRKRRASAGGVGVGADPFGDVFLVIDGWPTLRGEYDDLEPLVTDIATRGLSYGVHVVAAAPRWMDFRPAIRDLFGSRLELRLGDPTDSIIARKAAANVPEKTPGRGITAESLHFLTVLPELSSLGGGQTQALVKAVAGNWSGAPAPGSGCFRRCSPTPTWTSPVWPACGCRSASPRPTSSRCRSTSPPSRTSCSSATPSVASRPSCGRWPPRSPAGTPRSRPGSSWSTSGAACSA